ncbi:MAG: NifB/NifX family molybdenum-iron cluster-binding protein [Actinomycetota bacterium]|jgi:predicted Fe-Mo cluster-binding NifX family protein|nr:NifB/NifX family molybdenum-iron cluster-binding protein [Actinomycetota bacterium]
MQETMVVAVPSMGDTGMDSERSGHFGHCDYFTIVNVKDGAVQDVRLVKNVEHKEGGCLVPVNLLAAEGVTVLIVAGMGARPLIGFNNVGIDVYFDDKTPNVGDVVEHLLGGRLAQMNPQQVCGGH